jgi:hypothetical protein
LRWIVAVLRVLRFLVLGEHDGGLAGRERNGSGVSGVLSREGCELGEEEEGERGIS